MNDDNPYAAPEAPLVAVDPWGDNPLAGRIGSPGWRFVAFMIDYALFGLTTYAVQVVASGTVSPAPNKIQGEVAYALLLGWFFYFAVLESSTWQATLGKRWCKLYVMGRNGERIGFGRAVARTIIKTLPILGFLGMIPILFGRNRQGFHDILMRTFVIQGFPNQLGARR